MQHSECEPGVTSPPVGSVILSTKLFHGNSGRRNADQVVCDVYLCSTTKYRKSGPREKRTERKPHSQDAQKTLCQGCGVCTSVNEALKSMNRLELPSAMLPGDDCTAKPLEKWSILAKCSDQTFHSSSASDSLSLSPVLPDGASSSSSFLDGMNTLS